jgi:hypothetical protein
LWMLCLPGGLNVSVDRDSIMDWHQGGRGRL